MNTITLHCKKIYDMTYSRNKGDLYFYIKSQLKEITHLYDMYGWFYFRQIIQVLNLDTTEYPITLGWDRTKQHKMDIYITENFEKGCFDVVCNPYDISKE